MTLDDCLVDFSRSTIDGVNAWYRCPINPKFLPAGVTLPNGNDNDYARNVYLKLALSRLWHERDIEGRVDLAYYYVAVWGGVRANKKETLRRYVTTPPNEIIAGGPTGIASWSKVLCIIDPRQYAIFDARVSIALNSLQVIYDVRRPVLFPLLEGQNNKMIAGRKVFLGHSKAHAWPAVRDSEFYARYLALLRGAGEQTRNEIYPIEMALFAKAEELLDRAFPQEAS